MQREETEKEIFAKPFLETACIRQWRGRKGKEISSTIWHAELISVVARPGKRVIMLL